MRQTVQHPDHRKDAALNTVALVTALRHITRLERMTDYLIHTLNQYREEYGQKPIDKEDLA